MTTIIGLDPGPKESAWLILKDGKPDGFCKESNDKVRGLLKFYLGYGAQLVIESMVSYGQTVGEEVFETCRWIGRFEEAWGQPVIFLRRVDIKIHICGDGRAKDSGVRECLIRRWGGPEKAQGGKRCETCKGRGSTKGAKCLSCGGSGFSTPKGPLHGIAADVWSALALACTYHDKIEKAAKQTAGSGVL